MLVAFFLAVGIISCGSPSSPDVTSGTENNTLTFRENKNAVVAGDIAVSSDGGTTLKYVPADSWNESTYTDYTVIGVCVDTSFMINLVNEKMTWNAADEKYPDTDGWDLPRVVQLRAVSDALTALNTTLTRITGANTLLGKYYWTSQTDNDTRVWRVDLDNGKVNSLYYKTDISNVRVVRALD